MRTPPPTLLELLSGQDTSSKYDLFFHHCGADVKWRVACRFHSRGALASFFFWVKSWALPGIGMFCEVGTDA